MNSAQLVLVESNTTGTGRLFASSGRALGLRPVLLAADPSRYPYVIEDGLECITVDTSDPADVHAVCVGLDKQAPIAAVLSSSEYFVAAAARLAAEFGLPGPAPEAIERCRDKTAQLKALDGAVAVPRYAECATAEAAETAAKELGGDVVVKPCLGSGSEGVRACADPREAADWAATLLAKRHNERGAPIEPRVLVQERVDGPEYSVELLDGEVVGITAKHLGRPPFFVETGHDFPAALPPDRDAAIAASARAAVAALDLLTGPAHVELRYGADGPVLIEVNPRLAGGMIPQLVKLATGFDLITAVVAGASGAPARPEDLAGHHAAIRFLVLDRDGTITAVDGVDNAWETPGVVEVAMIARPGEDRARHHSFRDRLGYVIAIGETTADAATAAEAGRDAVRVALAETGETP
ncbi:ATP-grasp domain-containing protein [Stackebrandtia nassauensis]|uniref:ATP-grasp domain-containing protein n=1 Tax=Stackebrandtia nassauensis (strain DSM 44728 / CIP 108903 / NRRL B-16338 / NBRC 102104 / LLR-40K-21) TaxID=446470 RepID=D3Q4U1_STANL|nr:ATP-grasp domain-containing protein [Stackebrandtia nassauensis]ADD42121.1 protein of unknown function DUF201 [Stackebrandtia nassauensis DSM 44728]